MNMSNFKFNNNNEEQPQQADDSSMQTFSETTRDILSVIVRLCGLILLFIGLWIAIQVFNEALTLYKDPTQIERVAAAIEAGSNIDKSVAPLRDSLLGEDQENPEAQQEVQETSASGVRVSYFIAWVVDLLLLLLLARISLMAIKTGGELALYDAQIKKFARQIVKANKDE